MSLPARGEGASFGPVLVLVEGLHDAEFLRRISHVLSAQDRSTINLASLERAGQVAVLPLGGNGPQPWLGQLAALGKAAFYLFDRELPPESHARQAAVSRLNLGCRQRAFITAKRSLENYLHPLAVQAAGGVRVTIGDDDPVAEIVARQVLVTKGLACPWPSLSPRTRKRLRERSKRWLNREAAGLMTPRLLAERDPAGEVAAWLSTIGELVTRFC